MIHNPQPNSQHPKPKTIRLTVGALRIHCLAAGGSGPDVLMIHGGAYDSASLSWRLVLPELARHFSVLAPDLPGYGGSDIPRVRYSLEFYADFLDRLVERVGRPRISLVGLSTGGAIALAFALRRPSRVARLVLINSAGLGSPIPNRRRSRLLIRLPVLPRLLQQTAVLAPVLARRLISEQVSRLVWNPSIVTNPLVEEVWNEVRRPGSGQAWQGFLRAETDAAGILADQRAHLSGLRMPVLIVHGLCDRLIPPDYARQAARKIPDCRLSPLPDCAHWPPRETPAALTAELIRFLKDCPGNIGGSSK